MESNSIAGASMDIWRIVNQLAVGSNLDVVNLVIIIINPAVGRIVVPVVIASFDAEGPCRCRSQEQ